MSETLPIADAKQTRAWLWSELRVRRGEVAGTLAVGVLAAAASIIPIYALGLLVDHARNQLGREDADQERADHLAGAAAQLRPEPGAGLPRGRDGQDLAHLSTN